MADTSHRQTAPEAHGGEVGKAQEEACQVKEEVSQPNEVDGRHVDLREDYRLRIQGKRGHLKPQILFRLHLRLKQYMDLHLLMSTLQRRLKFALSALRPSFTRP